MTIVGSTGDPMKTVNGDAIRKESREERLGIVEYTRFPRVAPEQRPRIGFTRDVSGMGMCLGVDDTEPIGSLLRITFRGLDGRAAQPSIHRVVWCSSERDGRYWLGLELLSERQERFSPELDPTVRTGDAANA
ncbi:MAG: PilZ domain-containing protein [Myxococcales bacterium]|nr:PilZ domain-containing protein [Myxococcales bacterium]